MPTELKIVQEAEAVKEEEELTEAGAREVPNIQIKQPEHKPQLDPFKVVEAALFLANKPIHYSDLQKMASVDKNKLLEILKQISSLYPEGRPIELVLTETGACLQVRPQYLSAVSSLSKEVELPKKAMRILALVAKKKQILQSDLLDYFRGEIYEYVSQLKEAGYLDSKRHGNTRLLRPTTKFYEHFMLGG